MWNVVRNVFRLLAKEISVEHKSVLCGLAGENVIELGIFVFMPLVKRVHMPSLLLCSSASFEVSFS